MTTQQISATAIAFTPEQILEKAIVFLASRCDFAETQDGAGFNGLDATFGHNLADQIKHHGRLTPAQHKAACKLLKKYRKQIKNGIGLDVPNLKDLEEVISYSQIDEYTWRSVNESKGTIYEIGTDGDRTVLACTCTAFSFRSWCDHAEGLAKKLGEMNSQNEIVLHDRQIVKHECYTQCNAELNDDEALGDCATGFEESDAENNLEIFSEIQELRSGLSEQQQDAFDRIREWFADGGKTPYVLAGSAGTGKSYSIQRIVQSLRVDRPWLKIAFASPTHKAKAVLVDFASRAGLGNITIATIYSLCHLYPGRYSKDGKQLLEINTRSQEAYYDEFDLVVVDEGSMLGEEVLRFMPFNGNTQVKIPESKRPRLKFVPTIFMGDPAQLPPIATEDDEEKAIALDQSPIFNFDGVRLTQVVRYDGEIAKYVTCIREDINRQYPPKLINAGNMSKLEPKEWEQRLIEQFRGCDIVANPNQVKALAWTNAKVASINKLIRSALLGDAASETFLPNERIMAKEPIMREIGDDEYGRTRKETLMYSCAEGVVTSVSPCKIEITPPYLLDELYEDGLTVDGYKLTIRTDLQLEFDQRAIAQNALQKVRIFVSDWKEAILNLEPDERGSDWKEFYTFLESYALAYKGKSLLQRLQYAYALTVHQSQGSTFENTFVDMVNIMGCQETSKRNKLLYTAFTRASKKLNVLSKF
jgi:UvrD-like helicase C-terminal domain/AAA domain